MLRSSCLNSIGDRSARASTSLSSSEHAGPRPEEVPISFLSTGLAGRNKAPASLLGWRPHAAGRARRTPSPEVHRESFSSPTPRVNRDPPDLASDCDRDRGGPAGADRQPSGRVVRSGGHHCAPSWRALAYPVSSSDVGAPKGQGAIGLIDKAFRVVPQACQNGQYVAVNPGRRQRGDPGISRMVEPQVTQGVE